MSAIDSSGLVGVSTQISRVRSVSAGAHRVDIGQRHRCVLTPHCVNTLSISRNVPP